MSHEQQSDGDDALNNWPETAEEFAIQARPILAVLETQARKLGMQTTAEMMRHTANTAMQEGRPDRAKPSN